MDTASSATALTTMTLAWLALLAWLASSCWRVPTGLSSLYGGVDRIRNVVIRAGERGCGIN